MVCLIRWLPDSEGFHGWLVLVVASANEADRALFSSFPRDHESGIIFVIRNGLRWRDAPRDYGPHKTIYNRFVRWSRLGVFNKIFAELARKAGKPSRLMIDATHLKAHRTAASLLKKGLFPDVSGVRKAA